MQNYSDMLDFEINFWVAEVTGKTADYCNSWADAFPTAEGLMSNKFVSDPNPLRAAMIVFLMMKEKTIG